MTRALSPKRSSPPTQPFAERYHATRARLARCFQHAECAACLLPRLIFASYLHMRGHRAETTARSRPWSQRWLRDAARSALAGLFPGTISPTFRLDTATARHVLAFLAGLPWRRRACPADIDAFSALLETLPESDLAQKQRGTHATAADVARYLARNTILPFLLRVAGLDQPDSLPWQLLSRAPDRYLPAAIRHGVEEPLPPRIAAGLADVTARAHWNRRVPARFGPHGETWREHLARRERCQTVRRRLGPGQRHDAAELIAGNLDLTTLMLDVVEQADPVSLLTIWNSLQGLSILDPTCGTGAFLFAALRTLDPIVTACLLRVEALLSDSGTCAPDQGAAFQTILDQQAVFSSRRCFVLTRILAHNLHGVDLAPEAVEICRLRLRLELACSSHNEELDRVPDLNDNLRVGNALLGRARPHEVSPPEAEECSFDWPNAFPAIMERGGFDVILGNPPYLELRQVDYVPGGFACAQTGAVHALCVERGLQLLQPAGFLGMVVPLALASTQRMRCVQELLEAGRHAWYAHFGWRPARLFPAVNRAVTVLVSTQAPLGRTFSTAYQKWATRDRPQLMDRIAYVEVPRERPSFWVPKLGEECERNLLEKCLAIPGTVGDCEARAGGPRVYYRTDGGLYWKVFTDFPPAFTLAGQVGHSTRETSFAVADPAFVSPLIAALSSDLFWWWYTVTSNCRHLNPTDIRSFPLPASALADPRLSELGRLYLRDIVRHSQMRVRCQRQTGRTETQSFEIRRSRAWIEQIDRVLAGHYGLSAEELDFVVHYDIRFRMGTR